MWILPKQLISAFAQDTEALTSDSVELSQTCAQSLMRRSKPSPAKTYLREWKAGNLMRLRSGAISSHFLGRTFRDWWISCLVATRVSHSAVQGNEPEQTTQDTSGLLFQPELLFCDQVSVSLKTSKDISRWGCPTLSKTWDAWVIEQRGEYSQRLNAARLTSVKECSSWPTARTNDSAAGRPNDGKDRIGKKGQRFGINLADKVIAIQNWPTPNCPAPHDSSNSAANLAYLPRQRGIKHVLVDLMNGQAAPDNHNTHGSRPESWATPQARDWKEGSNPQPHGQQQTQLPQQTAPGMLNPRWVETLMGLPVGWTMPSCQSPMTIAQTNCDCLATESSQQQQP